MNKNGSGQRQGRPGRSQQRNTSPDSPGQRQGRPGRSHQGNTSPGQRQGNPGTSQQHDTSPDSPGSNLQTKLEGLQTELEKVKKMFADEYTVRPAVPQNAPRSKSVSPTRPPGGSNAQGGGHLAGHSAVPATATATATSPQTRSKSVGPQGATSGHPQTSQSVGCPNLPTFLPTVSASSANYFKLWLFIDEILKFAKQYFIQAWNKDFPKEVVVSFNWNDDNRQPVRDKFPFKNKDLNVYLEGKMGNIFETFRTRSIEVWDTTIFTNAVMAICEIQLRERQSEPWGPLLASCNMLRIERNNLAHHSIRVDGKDFSLVWNELNKIANLLKMPSNKIRDVEKSDVQVYTPTMDENDVNNLINAGDAALQRGNYNEALRIYQNALYISEINLKQNNDLILKALVKCSQAAQKVSCKELAQVYHECSLKKMPEKK